ncbi:hypothetical protein SteCoe_20224 [Stentor coeruleus]|uniref:Maleylacetoacetate isomerase n=1 Tax=Stentor coeruleus TaxID=5963 RepID=A0A1R2BSG9_9CILI|nr:hypothetical protein SteCoe_20224 [Stentor coeruleus]
MDLTLYGYWRSSASWRVRIALALKNIEFNYIPVNLLQGGNTSAEYLQKNPLGQVPTFVDGSFSLTQSFAIIHYIESKYPDGPLIPANIEQMARMWEIAEIVNSGIQPLQNLPILDLAEKSGISKKEWAQTVINEGFVAIEQILRNTAGNYCVGDQITVADICLVPQIYNAKRFEVDMSAFPIISRIGDALNLLPAFVKAHPDSQSDAVIGK